jgi:TRAP-type C4-dicarboxylate transport system substrate-binding protein
VPEVLAVSRQRWQRLSEADRAVLRMAARESAEHQRRLWAEREVASRQRVAASGVTVIDLTDRAPWAALMEPVYAKYAADPRLARLVAAIRETR